MRRSYLGAVMGEDGSYGIVFRDFPGCISAGDTLEEVLAMGAEALQGHVEAMLDAGDFIPDPSVYTVADADAWLSEPDDSVTDAWVGVFPVEIEIPERGDTVTIRMKADLVQKIADVAVRQASPRIGSRDFIERAVEHELERYRKSA